MNTAIKIGIIGGSGLGEAFEVEGGKAVQPMTPFGPPSGPLMQTTWQGVDIVILKRHGEGHLLNPTQVPYRANIFAMKMLGVTHIIASGATGSLREEIAPGDLVIADQVIDKTTKRIGTFYENAAVHVEMAEPFCPVMRQWLLQIKHRATKDKKLTRLDTVRVHDGGTYVCMEGPAFSTRAESLMHRSWGGDMIGMTCMPEAKLAREAEIAYALIGLPTDYDCWRPHEPNVAQMDLLTEILGNLKNASDAGVELIQSALMDINYLHQNPSPAHSALKLAIWSDKKQIPPDEIERLKPLWGQYFA